MNIRTWPNFPDIRAGENVSLGKTTYFGDKRLAVFVIGDPRDFKTFDDFFDAVKKHIDFAVAARPR